MTDGLKDYLAGKETKPMDGAIWAEYMRSMTEECIPKIEADLRWQARARVCLIYHPRGCQCCNIPEPKP